MWCVAAHAGWTERRRAWCSDSRTRTSSCLFSPRRPLYQICHLRHFPAVPVWGIAISPCRWRDSRASGAEFVLGLHVGIPGQNLKGEQAVDRDLFKGQNLKEEQEAKGLEAVDTDLFKAENLKEEQAERVLRQLIGSCSPLKRPGNKHHGAEFVFGFTFGFTCGHSRTKSQGGAGGKGLEAVDRLLLSLEKVWK